MRSTRLDVERTRLAIALAAVVLAFAANLMVSAQVAYKVGDRVEAEWRAGRWYAARILEIQDGNYKVRYELDGVVDTVKSDRLRPIGGSASTAGSTGSSAPKLTPTMAGGFPSLQDTAWKIDFGKGVTGTIFLFCKTSRRWEIVPQRAGTIGAIGKSYTVSGSTLTTVNADDGLVQKWKMTWKDGVLEIFDGKTTLKLHYNGTTQC